MARIWIQGGRRIEGQVRVERAKNALLPILAATLLTPHEVVLRDVPWIEDVDLLVRILRLLGVGINRTGSTLLLQADEVRRFDAPYYLAGRMRASVLVAGPLLARFGRAVLPLPGGCSIGARPINLHLKGLEAMGATVRVEGGTVRLASDRLKGAHIYLDFPSVGATENLIMAATLAQGTTILENVAEEPEIEDLVRFLQHLGAAIDQVGSRRLRIVGQPDLGGGSWRPVADRVEAGTFLIAAAITKGSIYVEGAREEHLGPVVAKLREAGAEITCGEAGIRLSMEGRPKPVDVTTMPYPGFPTDLQAPMMSLLATAGGLSLVRETVFENRFRHAAELGRMGAKIRTSGQVAYIEGTPKLKGAEVEATDLRAAAALVIAGLAAEGTTSVLSAEHLDRGYHNLEAKLGLLGASIERATD